MSTPGAAELALKQGDALQALRLLTEQVRGRPQDARLRVFMFQLLAVLGQWERALNQLQVALELDAGMLPMVQTYREAIACETLRLEVFAGRRAPMLFGEPQAWVALLIEALSREGSGDAAAARALRAQALEQAPPSAGQITLGDDAAQPFAWIADADARLGPTLEAVINGRYFWLPWNRLARITFEPPRDLRDAVWMPAQLQLANGGEAVALVPTRYPGTDLARGDALALARRTEWHEQEPGVYTGLGQRLLATDLAEFGLMDLRGVVLDAAAA